MLSTINQDNGDHLAVSGVECWVVQDRELLPCDTDLGRDLRDDFPGGLAQVAARLADERDSGHVSRLGSLPARPRANAPGLI